MCVCSSCSGPALNECQLALVQAWAPMRPIDTSLGLDCLVSMQPWSCSLITLALRAWTVLQTTLHWGWLDPTKQWEPHPSYTPCLSALDAKMSGHTSNQHSYKDTYRHAPQTTFFFLHASVPFSIYSLHENTQHLEATEQELDGGRKLNVGRTGGEMGWIEGNER